MMVSRRLKSLDRRIQALAPREWWAMLLVGALLFIAAGQQFSGRDMSRQQEQMEARLAAANKTLTQIQEANKQPEPQKSEMNANVLTLDALTQREISLRQELEFAQQQLASISARRIDAKQMPMLLDRIFVAASDVQLNKLSNTGSTALLPDAVPSSQQFAGSDKLAGGLYQHSLELQLEGNFDQLKTALTNLQMHRDTIKITSLDYQVGTYPVAQMTLGLNVYVNAADWLGI